MWKVVLILMSIPSVVKTAEEASRPLEPPTNLTARMVTETFAMLFWNFTEPEDTCVCGVNFVLSLEAEGIKLEKHLDRRALSCGLIGLKPFSRYTVKLRAIHQKWAESAYAEISLVTVAEDMPTPRITDVEPMITQDWVEYTVKWELSHNFRTPSFFEVLYCRSACKTITKSGAENNATFSVGCYKKFTVQVTAFYNESGAGLVGRKSSVYYGTSVWNAPSRVENITRVGQMGNKLSIEWQLPRVLNGPISYYEVFVHDPQNPLSVAGRNVSSGTYTTLFAPALRGDVYKINIRAVNLDSNGSSYKSEYADFSFRRSVPPKPRVVVVLDRATDRIEFLLVTPNLNDDSIIEIKSEAKVRQIHSGRGYAEAFDLEPHQPIIVSARCCFRHTQTTTLSCGEYAHFKLYSNVAVPSVVRNLKATRLENSNSIRLTWHEPAMPRGPVNGYRVAVKIFSSRKKRTELYVLDGTTREFVHEKIDKRFKYEFGVSAINEDLQDQHEHVGVWEFIVLEATDHTARFCFYISGVVFVILIFLLSLDESLNARDQTDRRVYRHHARAA